MQRKYLRAMRRGKFLILSIVVLKSILLPAIGFALPTSGAVVSGSGTVTQTGSTMNINQTTSNLIMNWNQFNIGAGEKVNFLQPSVNSVSLNRVLGSDPSQIFGQLSANGKVFLVNPNGVLFAPNARVDVGGLVATSMNISDQDFLAGKYRFTQGTTSGSVINQGSINAGNGGYVALFAPEVRNEGVLVTKLGTVALGAGRQVTLDVNGDGLLHLNVDQAILNANIVNKGLIQVEGGQAILSAKAGNALLATVINNEGVIEAKSIANHNGVIFLEGDSGIVANSGTLDVSGRLSGQTGGTIKVLGEKVGLFDIAKLDASGYAGGGTILIGGNYQGKGSEQNAQKTFVGKNTIIHADALVTGDGGKVVVWADDKTQFQGKITVSGGTVSGNGGSVEVSGKKVLNYQGNVELQALKGKDGTLLLDPQDIVIDSSGIDPMLSNTVAFSDGPATTTISGTALANAMVSGNVVLQANNDITFKDNVNANVLGAENHSLNLQAGNSIVFNPNVTLTTNHGDVIAAINDSLANPNTANFRMNDGAKIITNGGSVAISPGSGGAGYVWIGNGGSGALVDAGGGNISITGKGGTFQSTGLTVNTGSVIQTSASGNIMLRGIGENSLNDRNFGVGIYGGVSAVDGAIDIKGSSNGTTNHNYGISLDAGGYIRSIGSGTIGLEGIGGSGDTNNYGVYVANSSAITGKDGNISIVGVGRGSNIGSGIGNQGIVITKSATVSSTGIGGITIDGTGSNGGTSDNYGMYLNDNAIIKTANGDVTIKGTGGNGTFFNPGILLNHSSIIESTGNGKVTLTGTGGTGTHDNYGVYLMNGTVKTADGNVNITGMGKSDGTNSYNYGIRVDTNSLVESTKTGTLTLTGTGGNGINENDGVYLNGGKITSAFGNILVTGTGGNSTGNFNLGIRLQAGTIESTDNAKITLNGVGGNGLQDNYGLWILNDGIKTKDGNVMINSKANGVDFNNHGIRMEPSGWIQSTGTGTISLTGTGSNGTWGNTGIFMNGGTISSQVGDISLTGTGGNGSSNFNAGIRMDGGVVQSTGTAKIVLDGTGGNGLHDNYGVYVNNGKVKTVDGDAIITGKGNGTGFKNMGIRVDPTVLLESIGNGKLTLMGTGSNTGTHENHGVLLDTAPIKSVNGDVSIIGIAGGNNTDIYNAGIVLKNNAFISSGSSNLVLNGTGGKGSSQNYGIDASGTVLSPNGITSTHSNTTFIGTSTDGVSSDVYSKGGSISAQNISLQGKDAQGIELGNLNASGNLALTADKMVFNDTMTGMSGIIVQPSTIGKDVTLGGTGAGLNLTEADLNMLSTGILQIGTSTTGNITVASPLGQGSKNIILQTGSNIDINAPITNGTLILRGSNGNNNFNIGNGSLDGFTSMKVEGIGGNDVLTINDATSSHDNSYTITGTQIQYAPVGTMLGLSISYDNVNNLTCMAGVGRVNQVNSQFIPGVTQTLLGGNAAGSILNFDSLGTNPIITSSTITAPGYGTVTYSGFATVNLKNVVKPPTPPETPPTPPENLLDGKYTTAAYLGKKDEDKKVVEIKKKELVVTIKNGGVKLPDNVDINNSGVATGEKKE